MNALSPPWWAWALLGAVAAAGTTILVKLAADTLPSNFGAALRATVAVALLWTIAAASHEIKLQTLSRGSLACLVGAGLCTGVSWLAQFKAFTMADASRVQPIDKLSLPMTLVAAWLILHEKISPQGWLGAVLMLVGMLLLSFA